jgi:hypothetical protein
MGVRGCDTMKQNGMEYIDSVLADARRKGATVPPPASVEELRQCQSALKEKNLPPIPQRYFAFLKNICNGFAHGYQDFSCDFYGTKPLHIYNSNNLLEDIVKANEQAGDIRHRLFLLGRGSSVKYFYNMKTGLFETRSDTGYDLLVEYKTFMDMFGSETMRE